jgi:hypothetical protein
MAELRIDPADLRALVKEIVAQVTDELQQHQQMLKGKLAVSEPEAAELLGLNPWQLRDVRLKGKIGHSRIVGNRVRYSIQDLMTYLRQGHEVAKER